MLLGQVGSVSTVYASYGDAFPEGRFIRTERFPAYSKWLQVMEKDWARDATDEATCARNLGRPCRLLNWSRFVESLRKEDPAEQLRSINSYINQTRFIEDRDNWGAKDYWAAPAEFLTRGGDCEDYAISKYLSLRQLGIPAEQLRVVVLEDKRRRVAHAVLVVELGEESLVLDNLSDRVVSWSEVGHYRPLYSLNEQSAWLHVKVRDRL
ncbi:transglutaminase-like cysteine peptidase [Pelagibius sp. Alg239-R121]|uniref:transglutaminase-like cysteine peptidase n=1 Tax=Pelagibius sp. Alg239-R121 TaxID=2993448 RepID=UPI0024A67FC4|nr:transglutaminase-like cysteine peptidase [Pelagibius sp. Alg239-R121]